MTPLEALWSQVEAAPLDPRPESLGYGPLSPVNDLATGLPLLCLPPGFRYTSLSWVGDPMQGGTTPGLHDGMGTFAGPNGTVVLVRNHEISTDRGTFAAGPTYDALSGGGTTTLVFDPLTALLVDARASLVGTNTNCAGGRTPWGSWLTCEEIVKGAHGDSNLTREHGYIFEVPALGTADAMPLTAMGRFVHEAVAVDPATGIVYETEDMDNCGFYRFVPNTPGRLRAGGTLQMLALIDDKHVDLRTASDSSIEYDTTWVTIPDPDPANPEANGVFSQGRDAGGTRFRRLEGAFYGAGRIYIVSTSGGPAKKGQVWEYDPARERLRLVFASPSADVLDMPDNICMSPRGGLVLCEDGSGLEYLHGLTVDGTIFRFAQNNVVLQGERNGLVGDHRGSEFAGVCFSPDGEWLFVNVQEPGITFAITGPWQSGAL